MNASKPFANRKRKFRPAPGVLRILVIIFALLAGAISGSFGVYGAINRTSDIRTMEENPNLVQVREYTDWEGQRKVEYITVDKLRCDRVGLFLMIANFGLAIVACVCVETSRGWMAGILMVLAPIGPAIVQPATLLFTGLFIPTAIAAFVVFRRKAPPEEFGLPSLSRA
jgi:hypothetical protein